MKYSSQFWTLILIVILTSCRAKSWEESISDIRETTQKALDKSAEKHKNQNRYYDSLSAIIYNDPYPEVKAMLDSILELRSQDNRLWLLRGDLFTLHAKYEEAIRDYSLVVARDSSPISLEKRATVHILIKEYENAVEDLKFAAEINSDYWYSIGYTYELWNKIDSAVLYYNRYLNHTKNGSHQDHIDSLIKEIKQREVKL